MTDLPLVSIVTPSYNQAPFLEQTILSVLAQDYPNLEYIIVDGGSTDGSTEIIRQYDSHLSYWVSEPDRGQVEAINKGFARARGEILVWLNSDDVYVCPGTVSRVVSLFGQYPQVDAVSGGGVILNADGHWTRQTEVLPTRAQYQQLRFRNAILQPATFFKRYVLEALPLDDSLHYTFDWDFFIRLSKSFNLLVVQEVWAGYRMWGENKTGVGSAARSAEQAEVIRRYVGGRTWQYALLRLFWLLYRTVEGLPSTLHLPLKAIIRTVSAATSSLSRRRIPVV